MSGNTFQLQVLFRMKNAKVTSKLITRTDNGDVGGKALFPMSTTCMAQPKDHNPSLHAMVNNPMVRTCPWKVEEWQCKDTSVCPVPPNARPQLSPGKLHESQYFLGKENSSNEGKASF